MKTYDLTQSRRAAREDKSAQRRGARLPHLGKTVPPPRIDDESLWQENERLVEKAIALAVSAEMSEQALTAAKELIERARNAVNEMHDSIRDQIDLAKRRRYQAGQYSDPDWWHRINSALHAKARQRQQLQDKCAEVKRTLRALAQQNTRESRYYLFAQIARAHLPTETFEHLWRLVDEAERTRN
jgi:hypothetical protein